MRLAVALLALFAAAVLAVPVVRAGGSENGPLDPQPVLGTADTGMTLMGAGGEDVWGYRQLPQSIAPPVADGSELEFGPEVDEEGERPQRQLAFLRHTDSSGWQIAETPVDESGHAYRGGDTVNPLSARITPDGGGVLVVSDTRCITNPLPSCPPSANHDPETVLLVRDPGGPFAIRSGPLDDALLPRSGAEPAEELAENHGQGRLALAAVDEDGVTGLFFAAVGRAADAAVVHFDGERWSREPVQIPAGSEGRFKILAISATGPDNAWLVARADPSLGRGVLLFQRTTQGGAAHWVERNLGPTLLASRSSPASGVDEVEPLGGSAQALTATADGVWIDGSLRAASDGGRVSSFTAFFDRSAGQVTGTWCDPPDTAGHPLCDHPFGAKLSTQIGYRSFAWAGDGFGTRVVTNPLEPNGDGSTNRGTYLSLQGDGFVRMPGGGGNVRPSGAFSSADEGWLEGPVHITRSPEPERLKQTWPVSLRAPITSVAPAPRAPRGGLGAPALAVGIDGGVLRYEPGQGWAREFLLNSNGSVARSTLRGVAWPEAGRAYAVGDLGAMWLWRSDTGLWERDPAAPVGFEANLMDVAFDPANPDRGYAVGKAGALLRYDKTWTQEQLPSGLGSADFTQIAFAGSQAIVAAGSDLLVNDGSGWRVDPSAHALFDSLPETPQLFTVAGLPDGGAVAAGLNVVIERDGPGAPWRFAAQPLPGSTAIAAAAVREGGTVRAVVSVQQRPAYPPPDDLPPPDPNLPPPIVPPFPLPGDGYVLRETASGWSDEQHTAFAGSGPDRPVKSDPVLDFDLDASGQGWAVGGWSGEQDSAGRGSSGRNPTGRAQRQIAQTAGVYRYGGADAAPPGFAAAPVVLDPGTVRLAVAGHAQCEEACADLVSQRIGPDQNLSATLAQVAALHASPGGPRFLAYSGGRVSPGAGERELPAETARYAALLSSQPSLPVFPAASSADGNAGAQSFRQAFAGFGAPFGAGTAPPGVDASTIPGAPPATGARTHYAFDSSGPGGTLRVIVIDNSSGSLEASDPHQNPPEAQRPWLAGVLADAKARGIAAIVVGSRDLNTRFSPRLNTATDGADTAQLLVQGGASAYFFERPEENRTYRIPSGGAETIPSFGTGTLGYRSPVSDATQPTKPDALFGDSGFLLASVNVAQRDPTTNRAPVSVTMIPLIDDLSLQAVDGTLLRRSRPALFQGIGRRPIAGDRWGEISPADSNANPPGSDPYTGFPPAQCLVAGCSTRVPPDYEFRSSDPDIADFVRQDPQSTNLRKPLLGANDKVVSDSKSSLLCPFNAGTTTVTVLAGGRSFSQQVRVLPGSVQRPCGTRPLNPSRFRRTAPGGAPAPPPAAPQGGSQPPASFSAPPPPAPAAPPPVAKVAAKPSPPTALVPQPEAISPLPPVPLPFPPPAVRPSPPSGGLGRAYQLEREREEEVAPEESQAFSRYHPDDRGVPAGFLVAALVLAAFAGATIRGGPRALRRRAATATATPFDRRRLRP